MLDKISLVLVIIGAINWALIGIFQFDLVAYLFGGQVRWSAASSTPWWARPGCGASRCCSAAARCAPRRTMHNHRKNCTKADCRTEPQWPAGSLFFSFYQSSAAATVGTTRMPAAMSIV